MELLFLLSDNHSIRTTAHAGSSPLQVSVSSRGIEAAGKRKVENRSHLISLPLIAQCLTRAETTIRDQHRRPGKASIFALSYTRCRIFRAPVTLGIRTSVQPKAGEQHRRHLNIISASPIPPKSHNPAPPLTQHNQCIFHHPIPYLDPRLITPLTHLGSPEASQTPAPQFPFPGQPPDSCSQRIRRLNMPGTAAVPTRAYGAKQNLQDDDFLPFQKHGIMIPISPLSPTSIDLAVLVLVGKGTRIPFSSIPALLAGGENPPHLRRESTGPHCSIQESADDRAICPGRAIFRIY